MKKRDRADIEENEANLTPLIDVVFLMISFFVLVSDFSTMQLEQVELPSAMAADTDERQTEDRTMIVNVLASGNILIDRQRFGGPGIEDEVLNRHMATMAEVAGRESEPTGSGPAPSRLEVMIRADGHAPYEYVQKVFRACADNGVYKTIIRAYKEELSRGQ